MSKKVINISKVDFRLFILILVLLIGAQLVLMYYSKNAFHSFLLSTEDWYQNYSVKRIVNLTSTSLELLVETQLNQNKINPAQKNRIIKSFDIIFSQNIMEKNAEEICIFIYHKNKFLPIDDGLSLYNIFTDEGPVEFDTNKFAYAGKLFNSIKDSLIHAEKIKVILKEHNIFYVFSPFSPNGEFFGALYMKIIPDFNPISDQFVSSYNNVAIIYVLLVSSGLILIYIVFSFTLKGREKAQKLALQEHEKFIEEKVEREKENTFTRRIYHAYHKAEKVIGFINVDLELLKDDNLEKIRDSVRKYANFIGRVIYDMKYYDPPIHSIINPIFITNINEVCKFVIENLFLRIYKSQDTFSFKENYDPQLPVINVNEYIIWEIIEPIIQNSITHNSGKQIVISVSTKYDIENKRIMIYIADNGIGIAPGLLEKNHDGTQKLFLENISTRDLVDGHYGFGCYIAYTLAAKYCGWNMSAQNISPEGCMFTIEISVE